MLTGANNKHLPYTVKVFYIKSYIILLDCNYNCAYRRNVKPHKQLLHERPDLCGHDEQHWDHGAVVVSVDNEAHLLQALSEVARVVGEALDAVKTFAFPG